MLARVYFIAFLTLIIACSPQPKTVERAPVQKPAVVTTSPLDISLPTYTVPVQKMHGDTLSVWTSSLELVCNAKTCPPQVGLLVFVARENDMIYYSRCTASLIKSDQIITNGHCDQHDTKEGYFITQKINGKHRQIKIKDLEFKQYSANHETNPGEIDVAIFNLQQPVDRTEIIPFQLPSGETPPFQEMYLYVINEGSDQKTFVIDEKICTPQRHEMIFPFDFSENPDTFSIINCEIIPGNSGAPILSSRTSTTVEALAVGFSSREMQQELSMEQSGRSSFIYEDYQQMNATNLRCANIINGVTPVVSGCVRTNEEEVNRRINDYFLSFISLIENRELEDAKQLSITYEPYSYEIKENLVSPNRRFIIYHLPKCRKRRVNPQSITLIIEEVELVYDALARIEIKTNSRTETQAAVTNVYSNDVFGLRVQWPVIDREFKSTPASEQLGTDFNYSIPVCHLM